MGIDETLFHTSLVGSDRVVSAKERNIELTFLALGALGIAFLLYDWRYGRHTPVVKQFGSATEPPTTDSD